MKRHFCLKQKTASAASLLRLCLIIKENVSCIEWLQLSFGHKAYTWGTFFVGIFIKCTIKWREVRPSSTNETQVFIKSWKTLAVSTTDWMVELNFASGVVHQTRSLDVLILYHGISFIIWFLWTKPTIWLLILSFTKKKKCSRVFHVLSLWRI